MSQLIIDSISIEVVRKKIKNMHLTVYPPDGRVRLSAPLRIKEEAIRQMIESRLDWIKKHQLKFQQREQPVAQEFVSGEIHYLKGKAYTLEVIEKDAPSKVLLFNDTHIQLFIRTGSNAAQRAKVLNEWYRQQLKLEIPTLLEKWQPLMGVQANEWGIKQMKTKWGTCNIAAKRIWLNLELIKKPFRCLEYVLVHELVHLLERLHNARFHRFMDTFLPDWKACKTLLNSNSHFSAC